MMKTKIVAAMLCIVGISTTLKAQQICYSISDSENKIYKFNLANGSTISSQSLSSLSSPEAATLNLAGDTMWVLNADELHYIPVNSSLSNTKISGSNISSQQVSGSDGSLYISDFDAMSVDTSGEIWAGSASNNPCLLVVIDRSTGNIKEDYFGSGVDYLKVDNSAYTSLRFDAMAFDPMTNKLYANMNGLSQNYDYLFEINTSTGAMTLIKQFNQMSDVEGMAFDAKGDLYVSTGNNATNSSDDNKLWKVNLINGNATEMFGLGGSDVETCDCVIGDPLPGVEISGTIFYDKNENGTYGSGDFENTSIEVSLYSDVNGNGTYESGTDVFMESTNSLADGTYLFRIVYGSGTERYLVRLDTTDLPNGSDFFGDDVLAVTVTEGGIILDENNFGYESDVLNAFEGFAYGDSDNDQTFDSWESGITGVKVVLFEDDDCNGTVNSTDDRLDSTVVGSDGRYVFLQPYTAGGATVCYITKVDESTLPTSSTLTTDNVETASFNSGGTADQNNNFGIWGGSISALPVEWLSFEAHKLEGKVQLVWATASEENNSHYVVQRSSNGDEWTTVEEVLGMGTTVSITEYDAYDLKPSSGINYYRIKQVDYDGNFEFSKTVGVYYENDFQNLRITPNPASNVATISWDVKLREAQVELYSTNGVLLEVFEVLPGLEHLRVDLTSVKNGMYFIKLMSTESEITQPLMIAR